MTTDPDPPPLDWRGRLLVGVLWLLLTIGNLLPGDCLTCRPPH